MTSDTPHPTPEHPEPGPDPTPILTDEQLDFLNSLFDLARAGGEDDQARLLEAIDQGVPVNLANHNGDTLLILATYNNHPALVKALIERGAEVDRLNARGQSALSCAVFVQNEESVRALLAAGADPDAGPVSARAAVEMFALDSMRTLLEAEAGPARSADPRPPADPGA